MSKLPRAIIAVLLAVVLLVAGCSSSPASEGPISVGRIINYSTDTTEAPQVDSPAPDFQFEDASGQITSLDGLQGSPVLINFWATWCRPCKNEMPYLQQIYDEWSERGLVVLAINIGEQQSTVEKFLQSNGLSLPVLLDTDQMVAQIYSVRYIPATFFIDEDGVIKEIKIGDFRNVQEIENSLKKIMP